MEVKYMQFIYILNVKNKSSTTKHPLSTTIPYFSTTKYNRPLLARCVITPTFFRKRPKTDTLLIGSFTPLFFCSER